MQNYCMKTQECNYCTMEVHGTRPPFRGEGSTEKEMAVLDLDLDVGGLDGIPPPGGAAGLFVHKQSDSEFWSFFENWKIEIDFQSRRKKDGQRGAPLWKTVGSDPAASVCDALEAQNQLIWMKGVLEGRGKKMLEGVCRVTGDHPFLLIDDLTFDAVNKLAGWWRGGVVVLETSKCNFQVILNSGLPLSAARRLTCQRALAARFGGDPGACSGTQFHRFPGSSNHKNGGCWVTKLVLTQAPKGGDLTSQVLQLLDTAPAPKLAPKPTSKSIIQVAGANTGDPSRDAFVHALMGLKNGISPFILASQICDKFNQSGKHSRGRDGGMEWALRTVKNAGIKGLGKQPNWL